MSKTKLTWFGIRLTQKQSVTIFVLALIGTVILSFTTWTLIYQFFWIFRPRDYMDLDDYIRMLFSMIPMYSIYFAFFILCIYSLIRSRQIAKNYSETMFNQYQEMKTTLFCSNCGAKRLGAEKFCKSCGQELRF